ncbi:hypothetical protein [Paractinoplanes durhamensis]|uniref:Uncharacterized protein n=1 Tax=Paractinoplanes durhamensis TaxID=113563 RepID=A0ABQ3Z2X3_9ACTN|nr:hypothetical protein [Actinoplanes durhamensis]GIE04177.1 hypothetical protein Adu01nite_55270 [Actinoplanes durhamensis]
MAATDNPPTELSAWTWDDVVIHIFGMGNDNADGSSGKVLNRNLVAGPGVHWIQFVQAVDSGVIENYGDDSDGNLNVTPDDSNDIFFAVYKMWRENGKTYSRNLTVQAKVTFWDQQGGTSPAIAFETYYQGSRNALDKLFQDRDAIFDPTSFHSAGVLLHEAELYLTAADAALKQVLDDVGSDTSGLQGTAAGAFAASLKKLHDDIHFLARDMDAGTDHSWSKKVYETSNDLWDFRNKVNQSFGMFADHTVQWFNGFNPWTLRAALKQILSSVRIGNMKAVPITFPDPYGYGSSSGTVDITTASGWVALDTLMKGAWLKQAQVLDAEVRSVLGPFTDRLSTLADDVRDLTPPPTATTGNTNTGTDIPDVGGGTGSDIPDIGGGSGTDIPDVGGGSSADIPDISGGSGSSGLDGLGDLGSGSGSGGLDGLGSGSGSGSGSSGLDGLGDLGTSDLSTGGLGTGDLGSGGTGGLGDLGGSGLGSDLGVGTGAGTGGAGSLGSSIPILGGVSSGLGGLGGSSGSSGSSGLGGGSKASDLDQLGEGTASSLFPTDVDGADIGSLGGGAGLDGTTTAGTGLGENLAGLLGEPATSSVTTGSPLSSGSSSSGMPFMPPMGGMGGNGQQEDKERERKTWLEEDEEVWGTDPDCSVAVIGREELPAEPSVPVPAAPGRGGTRQTPGFSPLRRRG